MIDGRRARQKKAREQGRQAPAGRFRLGERLHAHGVTADAVTVVGILIAAGTAVAVGLGQFYVGVVLLIVGGLMDALDGAVAKAAGSSSPRGAFFDSVSDRLADFLMFGGVAWYFLRGTEPRLALLPIGVLGVSSLISYQRAKAESLGFSARGGLMERAERLILLGLGLLLHQWILVPVLWVLLVLCAATAAGRFVRVWRQAGGAPEPEPGRWRPARVESRWRSLREAGELRSPRAAARRQRREAVSLATRVRRVLSSSVAAERAAGRPASDRAARALRRRLDSER